MAWSFGDSFDLYAAPADAINGYWDSGPNIANLTLVAGRFSGSQAIHMIVTNLVGLVKSSGANDAVHHLVVAFNTATAISGSAVGAYLQLLDGVTGQVCVVFRSDGAILLTSGTSAGAILATYTGAFTAINTWYAFEFEIVINNTTGSFAVRKNGNNVNDFSATSLNTRVSANNYANKLTVGTGAGGMVLSFDDLFWQSGAATGTWLGDIRCYARMPASDQSVTFSKSPTNFLAQNTTSFPANSANNAANFVYSFAVVMPTNGTVTSLSLNFGAGITGHAKIAIYDATGAGGRSGVLVAQSVELTNPGTGVNTFSIVGGPTVQRGITYWVAILSDVVIAGLGGTTVSYDWIARTYSLGFPSSMVGFASSTLNGFGSIGMNITPFNAGCVNEPQEDGLTSYVYDSNPGDADFYGIASIASTPAQVIATTVRGYMQKSDAGTRTATVQLKSGATTVASPTLTLSSSGWLWTWRTDLTDPNTGSAWTPAAVNNAQIGPKTVA